MEYLIELAKGTVGQITEPRAQAERLAKTAKCSVEDAYLACQAASILLRYELARRVTQDSP